MHSLSRRSFLSIGASGLPGLTLPGLLRAQDVTRSAAVVRGEPTLPETRAKSCIVFFMEGGPSQVDLWDMKPDAPQQVRGLFKPINTSLPGFQICEELPQLAKVAKHLAVVRSVSHGIVDHNASSYFMLTGQRPFRKSQLIRGPSSENAPPYGSVLSKLRPSGQPIPDYVHLPKRFFNCGNFIPGVLAGSLGDSYDPLIAGDASRTDFEVPGLEERLSQTQFDDRRALLRVLNRTSTKGESAAFNRLDTFYERAFSLITSPRARKAFRIQDEPDSVRERYGFGRPMSDVQGKGLPHLGQSMLLARRLVEAGVGLVSVWAGAQAFDGHRNHFRDMKQGLCPPTDQAVSALLEDLAERGLLDETLFVALSEFGRTPKVGQVTSSAGAATNGRDHWPHAFTAIFAGAGLKSGMIHGATDRFAAYPTENPVTPQDIAATIYTILGINPETRIYDRLDRPHTLADGNPITALFV